MKNMRHLKILQILERYEIETQDELQEKLIEAGYDVTQATVSRDIKKLQVMKVAAGGGKYRYAAVKDPDSDTSQIMKFRSVLESVVKKVSVAGNLVIVKTIPGAAQAACAAIDSHGFGEIEGSIAGDDCIFLAVASTEDAQKLKKTLEMIV
ncbi:MAG: arginine repressor [Clostridia bacterium]|nr:arginine repressor [Clostridia bacterium]